MKNRIQSVMEATQDKPVAVLGCGVSGRAAAGLLQRLNREYVLYDEREGEDVERDFTAQQAARHSLVIVSPGFAASHPWLRAAEAAGCEIVGELDFAAGLWQGQVIAVTGTNGKTTVSEFLAFALRREGVNAIAVGNNGYPFSRLLQSSDGSPQSVAVCEVSSFQAEQIRFLQPDTVLWTNFAEDHMDRYLSLEHYFRAKWKLVTALRGNRLYVGASMAQALRRYGLTEPAGMREVHREGDHSAIPSGSPFESYPQQENYRLVQACWQDYGYDELSLQESALAFSLPRHRLSKVAELGGVSFWNDSKGTNFASVHAALASFPAEVIWIGGGRSKGGDLERFCAELAPKVSCACLIGEVAAELAEKLTAAGVDVMIHPSLDWAVIAAYQRASPGQHIVFSPGFSSFDQFRNYADRGVSFEKSVLSLKNQPVAVNQSEKD